MCKVAWYGGMLVSVVFGGITASGQQNVGGPPMVGAHRHQRPWIVLGGPSPASRVEEDDDAKRFERVMADQATSEQAGAYRSMVKTTTEAMQQMQSLQGRLEKRRSTAEIVDNGRALHELLNSIGYQNKRFVEELTKQQRVGLKNVVLKLEKAEADLAREANLLDQRMEEVNLDVTQLGFSAKSLNQALRTFHEQQMELGDDMGIVIEGDGRDLSFELAPVKNSVAIGDQAVMITLSGTLSKIAADGGGSVFELRLTADLSDLQQNMTNILRSKLNHGEGCGERIEVQQAALSAKEPGSLALTQLHYEWWSCHPGGGENLMAESAGTVEVKLTPVVEQGNGLRLVSELGRVDADGMLREQLRSGTLAEKLRDEVTEALLPAVQAMMSFKTTLPAAAQDDATLQKAEFREASGLQAVLGGRVRIPDQEVKLLASQLKGYARPTQ
ncbi:MAG TPA: hypothetical protein VEI01_20025 [Terriglobales bacterium]|nr:hypothetical protein [Terriglobales bacterium]